MKPDRLLCYMLLLAFLDLTVHNVQYHSYQFIQSQFVKEKTKDCAP